MIRVGTSGWSYPEWRGTLYPTGTTAANYLKIYAGSFDTVEVNNTFYRIPRYDMIKAWAEKTPPGFLFSAKLWRGIVHANEINTRQIGDFFAALEGFGDKMGPVVIQLPPRRAADHEWLDALLAALPGENRYTVELRDRTWLNDDVYAVLRKHNAANCYYDLKAFRNPEIATSDWIYLRLHGPMARPYIGGYSPQRLTHYAQLLKNNRGDGYIYFDNTASGHAIEDARTLLRYIADGTEEAA